MARQLFSRIFSPGLTFCVLALLPLSAARAEELPGRKPGLWEMKMVRTGSPLPEMTMQHCTDEATDKEMSAAFAPLSKDCSKRDIQKTATGYVSDSVCDVGGAVTTSHSDITGDFNSAFTVKSTSHREGGSSSLLPRDSTMTIAAKWLGACKPGQKPGDIVMPNGFKLNVKDAEKLKGLAPK